MADTDFEKGGGALTHNFQINDFGRSLTLKKAKFVGKGEGRPPPPPPPPAPFKSATGLSDELGTL